MEKEKLENTEMRKKKCMALALISPHGSRCISEECRLAIQNIFLDIIEVKLLTLKISCKQASL